MTTKPYSCWTCAYFKPDDPGSSTQGRCHRFAPHALDYYGFSGIDIETPLTTKGDLFTFDTDDTRLPVGVDGQVLTADSGEATGLKWETPSSGSSPLTTKGDVYTYSTDDTRLPVGTNGQRLTADSTTATGLKWETPETPPLTTKGDLFTFDTDDQRLPVGTNGQRLTADSTTATGLKWETPETPPLTTKGDLFTFDTDDQRLAVGTDGQMLIADSAEATGLKWVDRGIVVDYQAAYIGTNTGGAELAMGRNGATSFSNPEYAIAQQYSTYDNATEIPFATIPNAEIIAVSINLTSGAVYSGTVGANPHVRIFFYDISGTADTYRGVASVPVPQAKVGVSSNTGTDNYHYELLKLSTPITTFNGGFLGWRIDLTDTADNEVIYAVRNLTVKVWVRVPLSDILDSTLITTKAATKAAIEAAVIAAMTPAEGEGEADLVITGKAGADAETMAEAELEAEVDAEGKAAAPVLKSLSISPALTPTSAGKFSVIFDGATMWCGEYRKNPNTVPPLP